MEQSKSRAEFLREFDSLPDSAVVDEDMAAAVRNKKPSSLQRERWAGTGPRFVRDGRLVGYRKRDLVAYIDGCVVATAEAS
ncbi:MAG TPA: DNA-binding protein [Gammaproteobacteria bacterium]|nr:DNA-binding protein [Gammaproteobacteria bacterium]